MRKAVKLFLTLALVVGGLVASASAQVPHGVTLTWVNPTTPNLTVNTIYSSTTKGGPYSLVTTITPNTTYNIPLTLQNQGIQTYFVVTVTAAGMLESGYSNEASATFPVQSGPPSGLQAKSY